MASSYSNDIKLELITTGEKSGTWGTITNTNLQILEQAASGYYTADIGASDLALSLSNGATDSGKNLYYKFTGTLSANRTVTMPDSAERVFIVEDATNRNTSIFSLTVKTVSGTGVVIPIGSKVVLYSDGTNISRGPITKGYITPGATYTTVNGDQVLVDTSGGGIGAPVTINLPASPSVGHEVTFIDSGNNLASNNLIIGRNGSNVLGSASDLTVSTNSVAFTLVYVNATRGWIYKDNI
jgi:phage baseplate assembly protein gpV